MADMSPAGGNPQPAIDQQAVISQALPNMRPTSDKLNPVLLGLEPAAVWEQFDKISRIPRPSGHEEAVREFLRDLAIVHCFNIREDRAGNMVIEVPGKGSGVNAPTVVIQAHMDMVCVKDPGVQHDFMKDPIRLQIAERDFDGAKKEVLTACGTTLGADNGIGLATGIAAAVSPEIVNRPPLELLCTFDEERGLTGAKELDPSIVKGRLLLNLDTEEFGCIYISCAGGRDMVGEWKLNRTPRSADDVPMKISISGLPGGHSGAEIHEKRGNSNLMIVNALLGSGLDLDEVRLASLDGGSKRNVIPSVTDAVVWVPQAKAAEIKAKLEDPALLSAIRGQVDQKYASFRYEVQPADPAATPDPIEKAQGRAILEAIASIPNGVQSWSPAKKDLVETSNNVAVFTTGAGSFQVCCMTRSSKDGAIESLQEGVRPKLESSGASLTFEHDSPGWEADMHNPLLVQAQDTFKRVLGIDPEIKAIHAGLECGAFRKHIPDIKMISFGLDIREAHTTKELVILDTADPYWKCVVALLEDLAKS